MEIVYGKLDRDAAFLVFNAMFKKYEDATKKEHVPKILFNFVMIPAQTVACSMALGYAFFLLHMFDRIMINYWIAYAIVFVLYFAMIRRRIYPKLFVSEAYSEITDLLIEYGALYALQDDLKRGYKNICVETSKHKIFVFVDEADHVSGSEGGMGYCYSFHRNRISSDFWENSKLDFSWVDRSIFQIIKTNQLNLHLGEEW